MVCALIRSASPVATSLTRSADMVREDKCLGDDKVREDKEESNWATVSWCTK